MPSTSKTGSSCVVACDVSKQPPWSIATSTSTAPGRISAEHLARDELRRERARDEHGADHHVGVAAATSSICRRFDIASVTRPSSAISSSRIRSTDLSSTQTSRLHAERDDRRVEPDDAAAEDDDLRRRHARHAAEQDPAAAVRLLERPGAHLRREPARDLAHRREQRQPAVGGLDRLVGDRGDPRVDERARQRLVRGDVEVREERQPLAEPRVLGRDRLLHLEQELGRGPDLLDRREPRPDRRVRLVGERPTRSRAASRRRPRGRAGRARARRRASARRGTPAA